MRIALLGPLAIALLRSCSSPAPVTLTTANAVESSIGVNLHLEYDATPYANPDNTLAALRFLGVTHVRDAALRSGSRRLVRFSALARRKIRFDLFFNRDIGVQLARVDKLLQEVPASVDEVEGPNEANHEGFTGGSPGNNHAVQSYQSRLYAQSHGDPALAAIPVLNFTYWPPLAGRADAANFHAYPSTRFAVGRQLIWQQRLASAVEPSRSAIFCTEAGFTTGGTDSVSERRQAELEPILLLENFRSGVQRTYLYELFDEHRDAIGISVDREDHWGLFTTDDQPKPAAYAIRRLVGLLAGHGLTSGAQVSSPTWLTLQGRRLRKLRVQRQDGSRLTLVWPSDADEDLHRSIEVGLPAGGVAELIDIASGTRSIVRNHSRVSAGGGPVALLQEANRGKN